MKNRANHFSPAGLLLLMGMAAAAGLLYVSGIGCVWNRLFGITCPGCGMTRALVAALHGNLAAALRWHPMVWSLPLIALYLLFGGRLFRNALLNYGVLILIGAGFLLTFLCRLL